MDNDNKYTFANNLKRLMEQNGKTRRDLSQVLGVSYFTITSWVNGTKYPRMDKVELLAQYFGVLKSDLIEDKEETEQLTHDEPKLTEGEQEWLSLFRQMPDDVRKAYTEALRISLKTQSRD